METINYGEEFTDKIYAHKNQVAKVLKVQVVDNIWAQITQYRSKFTTALELRNIDGSRYSVCLSYGIKNTIYDIDSLFMKLERKLNRMEITEGKIQYLHEKLASCLKAVADHLHIDADDQMCKMIAMNAISALPASSYPLQKYSSVLVKIFNEDKMVKDMRSEVFMRNVCKELFDMNGDIYRTKDNNKSNNSDNIYDEAPSTMVPELMDSLFDFIEDSKLSPILNAIILIYYITYIKPFQYYNEEIAVLVAKHYLLKNDLSGNVALVNLEYIIFNNVELNLANRITQRYVDVTYFATFIFERLKENIAKIIDESVKANVYDMQKETYQEEQKEAFEEDSKSEEKNDKPFTLEESKISDNAHEIKVSEEKEVSKEQPLDIPVVEQKESLLGGDDEGIIFTRQSAITTLTTGYSEEKAKQVENYLLESNPYLTQSQAFFYARHCTLGKYYTISQYKHEVGCAYETARSSMDKLVTQGYYAKEPYKNKFVYTPIRKK